MRLPSCVQVSGAFLSGSGRGEGCLGIVNIGCLVCLGLFVASLICGAYELMERKFGKKEEISQSATMRTDFRRYGDVLSFRMPFPPIFFAATLERVSSFSIWLGWSWLLVCLHRSGGLGRRRWWWCMLNAFGTLLLLLLLSTQWRLCGSLESALVVVADSESKGMNHMEWFFEPTSLVFDVDVGVPLHLRRRLQHLSSLSLCVLGLGSVGVLLGWALAMIFNVLLGLVFDFMCFVGFVCYFSVSMCLVYLVL